MKKKLLLVLLIGVLVLAACGGGNDSNAGVNNPSENGDTGAQDSAADAAWAATLNDSEGEVSAKQPGDNDFSTAVDGMELEIAGQVQTGNESRVKMDFPDGTVVRVGPDSVFTLETIEGEEDNLLKKLSVEIGQIWIALNGGSMEVDSPSGVASVRGSYMSIAYDPVTGVYYLTCLEGTCTLTDDDGNTIVFAAGETAVIEGPGTPPEKGEMDDEDFQDWLDNSDEAADFLLSECEDIDGNGVIDFYEYFVCALVTWNDDLPDEGSISDYVWFDANQNGLQDADEVGVAEVDVVLYSNAGVKVGSTMTDAEGFYIFEGLNTGEYIVEFFAPDDYMFTLKDEGGNDSVDSDANDTGLTDVFVLGPNEDKDDVDAGLVMETTAGGGATCPLTGLPVDNPDDLNRRPIGMSISHFPPEATRPPTGINWAPFVYEIFTGEGQTRLFAIFYCGYPEITFGQGGGEPAEPNENNYPAVGNWVWGDVNANGIQDKDADGNNLEPGVPEITVKLFEQKGTFVAETETDEYGYYFFDNVAPGKYYVTFNTGKTGYEFTDYQVPDDPEVDSDALANGVTAVFEVTEGYVDDIDAGMVIVVRIEGVRSGRVLYVDIIKYFGGGLIYQGADPRVEAVIGNMKCASASSSDSSNIGSGGIDVTRLADVADECQVDGGNTDLNVYEFGPIDMDYQMADEFMMFYNIFNRTHWKYDAGLGGYVRYQNSINEPEVFTMSTDKMSGDPVVRANVIVLFTKHDVLNSAGTIIDISLDYQEGNARLFRDGMMYKICWDTQPGSYPTESNRLRPVLFTDCNGNIIPLAPGSTWINVVDVTAAFYFDEAKGWWYARFYAPQFSPE